jgi:hypothetical protein
MRKINWPVWLGLLLSVFALFSYPLLFVRWPATRDFPWANIALFLVADVLLMVGMRRAFAQGRHLLSKIVASVVTAISALVLAMFILVAFVGARWLPPSTGAPQVSQKAPEFTLKDTSNKPESLAELLMQPINNKPARGVLLIFYRGYW